MKNFWHRFHVNSRARENGNFFLISSAFSFVVVAVLFHSCDQPKVSVSVSPSWKCAHAPFMMMRNDWPFFPRKNNGINFLRKAFIGIKVDGRRAALQRFCTTADRQKWNRPAKRKEKSQMDTGRVLAERTRVAKQQLN